MVSFSCEACNETMVKKKVLPHLNRCRAAVTCIDCSKTFPGQSFKDHNQCITEDEKYQGKLYRGKSQNASAPVGKLQQTKSSSTRHSIADSSGNLEKSDAAKPKEKGPAKDQKTKGTIVKVSKEAPLKKVIKKLRKKHSVDKDALLHKLSVNSEGQLVLNL